MRVMTLTMLFDVLVACVRVCVCVTCGVIVSIQRQKLLNFFLICCALNFPWFIS